MNRVSAEETNLHLIEDALTRIEKQQEHDKNKVEKAIKRAEKHGGVDLYLGDHFEIGKGGDTYVSSVAMHSDISIGNMGPSLKAEMYIVGRDPKNPGDLVYYKIEPSGVTERDCGPNADATISRFDLAIVPFDDRIRVFNIGKNKADLYYEGEVKF